MDTFVVLALVVGAFTFWGLKRRVAALERRLFEAEKHLATLSVGAIVADPAGIAESPVPADAVSDTTGARDAPAETPGTRDKAVAAEADTDEAAAAAIAEPLENNRWRHVAANDATPPPSAARLEETIGSRWAIWVGGLAFALGGLFLVRYSIEAGIFGPGVRLTMASIAGLLALAGGEFVRRRETAFAFAGDRGAHVPAILTAAGAAILFGVVYAAHGLYGFIGPGAAFGLLGLVSLATLALSIPHGNALAGLGLAGSYATPLLVSSQSPNPLALFGYLAIVFLAASALARLKDRAWVIVVAAAASAAWVVLEVLNTADLQSWSSFLALASLVIGATAIWLNARPDETFLGRAALTAASVFALALAAALIHLGVAWDFIAEQERLMQAALMALLAAAALWKRPALSAAPAASLLLAGLLARWAADFYEPLPAIAPDGAVQTFADVDGALTAYAAIAGTGLFALFCGMAWQIAQARFSAIVWAGSAIVASLAAYGALFLVHADFGEDPVYGSVALALAAIHAGAGYAISRRENPGWPLVNPSTVLMAAASLFLGVAIHLLTTPSWTGIAFAFVALALAFVSMRSPIAALPWMALAAGAVVFVRFAIDPGLTGADPLSPRPFLNWLLAGYGIPAAAFGLSAAMLARQGGGQLRRIMEAYAVTATLAGAAVLVRHWMQGGVLDSHGEMSLAEQSLYTLLALGASLTLIRLDDRAPSPVFRIASMAVGFAGMIIAGLRHLIWLNPVLTGQPVGDRPLVNELAIGYLLPGLLALLVLWFARTRRPRHYVMALAGFAGLMLFAWINLEIRRFWHGPALSAWKGTTQGETYTYSAAWLIAGLALLALGSRLGSRPMRAVSGALVMLTALKVFLVDMSQLQGVLRAVSFMGLGATLIGIGLFYQRLLSRNADSS